MPGSSPAAPRSTTTGRTPLRPRSRSSGHPHELERLVTAGKLVLGDDAHPRRVDLPLDDRRLQRGELQRSEQVLGAAAGNYPREVLRFPREALLPVRVWHLGSRLHDQARLRTRDAGEPGARAVDLASGQELLRILAQVPDVPVVVLRVVVEGLLQELRRGLVDVVADDGRGDPRDVLRLAGDVHPVELSLS